MSDQQISPEELLEAEKILSDIESEMNPDTSIFLSGERRDKFVRKLAILNREYHRIFAELVLHSVSISPEFQKIVDDNFFDLLSE